jgi:3-mercaptopyruvate sulfurtransferase SseA
LSRRKQIIELLGNQLGIDRNDHVIVYDQSDVFSAFRVYWTFKVFGHDKVSVLDGGLVKWLHEKRPVKPGQFKFEVSTYFHAIKFL